MKYSKQYPGYKPKDFFYGFIGKDISLQNHFFSNTEDIEKNKIPISQEIEITADSICFLKQVHSKKCVIIKNKTQCLKQLNGDALATNLKNVALTVHTADCVPVLFFDRKKQNIAIAHSGWKGAFKGILQNTVEAMKKLGSETKNIEAMIGPYIHQKSYEVDSAFYQQFISESANYKKFFVPSKKEIHFMFDLPQFNIELLAELGIKTIMNMEEDTYNSKQWFSYREDTHKNNKVRQGHILSFIRMR